ncbi:unnamed protein product [Pocillopora meandrina]|uniref:Uncharacterized protein n=1 Tax=Pocillopora meandrina TaxID=46732 RepID=A0AAU9VWV3_9CNID|nr:unnamed protein product [Pocillopora meandrina]
MSQERWQSMIREINFKEKKRSTEWMKRLLKLVSALNGEVTRLTRKNL